MLSGLLFGRGLTAQAQTLTTIHDFTGGADGAQPFSTLVKDNQGNLYGTTWSGGIQSSNCTMNGLGCGTVFKLTPSGNDWSLDVLHSFEGYPEDGSNPDAESLVFDGAGNIYGTAMTGGNSLACDGNGCGIAFKLAPDGTETILHNFTAAGADAFWPFSGFVRGQNGSFFGTTFHGGAYGNGTVYEVTSSGTERVLYNFTGVSDGGGPFGPLVLDQYGNLYGTASYGGVNDCGTVFKLAPDGTETVLYSFAGKPDGAMPYAGVVFDNDGNLYGTTMSGGADGMGSVFKVTPSGTETVIHSFEGLDGGGPRSSLVLDGSGNLYGTTYSGGASNLGAVFKLTPHGDEWQETVLHSFRYIGLHVTDGGSPFGSLLRDENGVMYGTTQLGGAYGWGTVYQLTLGPGTPTTTSLGSSLSSSTYGETVVLTAHVISDSGMPTGTVQIFNSSTVVGSGNLVNGSVSIAVSALPAGTDSIIASYLGGGGFEPSTSSQLIQTVTKAATTTSLTSSLNPAGTNQAISLSAVVSSQYGGVASGSVTFMAGSQSLGSASLSGSGATLTTSFATTGTYAITAQYNGDSNNIGSTSGAVSEKIIASTTTTVRSSLNPSSVGQAVTFTATVTSSGGSPPNGETITFFNGSAVLGTAALSGGAALLTTSTLPAGVFTITAGYPGDPDFAASTSAGLRQTVNSTTKSPTTSVLTSSLNPSTYGQKVTFTAQVTTSGPVPPTGTVSFTWSDGFRTFTIGTATLNSAGVATLTKSNLNADPYPLTAVYKGDASNLSSTSAIVNQTVLQTTSAATITSSTNPSTVGQAVTFTAQITSPTVTPSGPVTFKAGTIVLGTGQLSNGKATFTTSSLLAGSTVVKAIYNGDSNIKGSSASLTQTVQP